MTKKLFYDTLVQQTRGLIDTGEIVSASKAVELLLELRRYREFGLMRDFAEFVTQSDPHNPAVSKLYGQALIDSGLPGLGRDVLTAALSRTSEGHPEFVDILGVLGRAYKDICTINLARKQILEATQAARAAFEAYNSAFCTDKSNTYHGINVAAISAYCDAERIDLGMGVDASKIAKSIVGQIELTSEKTAWDIATLAEAHIPLEQWDKVEEYLTEYISDKHVNAFMIGGTLRQFRDVWGIGSKGKNGRNIQKILEAAYCQTSQFRSEEDSNVLHVTVKHARDVAETPDIEVQHLEKVLGDTGTLTFDWYKTGMKRAMSVASVTDESGRRQGTAFAIDNKKLGLPDPEPGTMNLMTNFHVLNSKGTGAVLPEDAHVRFEAISNDKYKTGEILFEDTYMHGGLDATVFKVKCELEGVEPIPIELRDLRVPLEGDRVYIIGYPMGGDLQFSLQDNHLIDHECAETCTPPKPDRRRLHYFAPTEPGNSGSPVFDKNWKCVALHHAGKKLDPPDDAGLKMLNGQEGRHSANEGIWVGSIKSAIEAKK